MQEERRVVGHRLRDVRTRRLPTPESEELQLPQLLLGGRPITAHQLRQSSSYASSMRHSSGSRRSNRRSGQAGGRDRTNRTRRQRTGRGRTPRRQTRRRSGRRGSSSGSRSRRLPSGRHRANRRPRPRRSGTTGGARTDRTATSRRSTTRRSAPFLTRHLHLVSQCLPRGQKEAARSPLTLLKGGLRPRGGRSDENRRLGRAERTEC